MKILDPGHKYALMNLDGPPTEQTLTFVKREGDGYPGNIGHHAGTNLQEVIRACMDRIVYLDNQIHCDANDIAIVALRNALWCLEVRAAQRHVRNLDPFLAHRIELEPVCSQCGHVGCAESC